MNARLFVLVAVAACRGRDERPAASTTPPPPPPHSPYGQVCPTGILSTKPWAHEVFPGCPPPQLDTEGMVCDGACPAPCRMTTQVQDSPPHTYDLTYDERGRLRSARDATPTGEETTYVYTGDHLASCTNRDGRCELEHDERGRLIHASIGEDSENFSYDSAGDLVEITDALLGHSTLVYDTGHRLVSERSATDELTYSYDDRGRVVGYTTRQRATSTNRHVYDANQRLARIVTSGRYSDDTADFAYDAHGRPVHYTRRGLLHGEPMVLEDMRFAYCDTSP